MNISAEDRTTYKDTNIGKSTSICTVKVEKESREYSDLQEKLADLLIRSSTD
jgi:hypothetical protein